MRRSRETGETVSVFLVPKPAFSPESPYVVEKLYPGLCQPRDLASPQSFLVIRVVVSSQGVDVGKECCSKDASTTADDEEEWELAMDDGEQDNEALGMQELGFEWDIKDRVSVNTGLGKMPRVMLTHPSGRWVLSSPHFSLNGGSTQLFSG